MLKIQDLKVSYGGIQALRGIDLEVPDGKIVTLIGANGAGKSTTLRTITGLVKAESGSIQWNGEELLGKSIDKIVSAGIAMSPEGRRVFADLTVLENLKLGAYLRKDKAEIEKDLKWVFELFPRLEERSWQSAGTLSGGEQQMLAVGRALMSRPKLMMLDEPSLGLAPLVVQDIFSIIREINRQGVTVLLIEQNANMALKIADLAYVLETGRITMSGTGAELLADYFAAGHPEVSAHTAAEVRAVLPDAPEDMNDLTAIPIEDADGVIRGVLSAGGLKRRAGSTAMLRSVGFSFAMLYSNTRTYRDMQRLGEGDTLTGLYNRNRYEIDLPNLAAKCQDSLGCVFVDVNGLHELNNSQGHEAGDQMLRSVSDATRCAPASAAAIPIGWAAMSSLSSCATRLWRTRKGACGN